MEANPNQRCTTDMSFDIFYHLRGDSINTSIISASNTASYPKLELVANLTRSFDAPIFTSLLILDVNSPEKRAKV